MSDEQQFYLFGQIQTSQTGGQPYSNTSPMVRILRIHEPKDKKADKQDRQMNSTRPLKLTNHNFLWD